MANPKSPLRIGYFCAHDPEDKRSWSGIHYRMLSALREHFVEVVPVGPVELDKRQHFWMKRKISATSLLHKIFRGGRFNRYHNSIRVAAYGEVLRKRLKNLEVDLLFAPAASVELLGVRSSLPTCYASDVSFGQLYGYYPTAHGYSAASLAESHAIEQYAIDHSMLQLYPSAWAADFAATRYGAQHAHVVPMGAAFDTPPSRAQAQHDFEGPLEVLFVGVDWARKGGPLVVETLDRLVAAGHNLTLTVIGCQPNISRPWLTVIPFLNKNKPTQAAQLAAAFSSSHLFFLPTRAEAYGLVFCEAAAYGLPVLATCTGGVPAIVLEGETGRLLPPEAGAEAFAEALQELLANRPLLAHMSAQARQRYEEQLNWEVWGQRVHQLITAAMSS